MMCFTDAMCKKTAALPFLLIVINVLLSVERLFVQQCSLFGLLPPFYQAPFFIYLLTMVIGAAPRFCEFYIHKTTIT